MSQVYSIYETRAKFSEILRKVKAGKEVIISERGHPIAKISPYSEEEESFESRLARLEAEGQIIKGSGKMEFRALAHRPGALATFLAERG